MSRVRHLVLGAVVGLVSFVAAISHPVGFVTGTAPFWENPRLDLKGHLVGYLHFLRAPWGWPIGTFRSVDPPDGMNIAMTDGIPIFALVVKLLAPLAPEGFVLRPYGLWLLFVYVLQGVVSARFLSWLGVRATPALAGGTILACSFSVFLFRFGHLALNAHFLVLWALFLVVRVRTEPPTRGRAIEVVSLTSLAALTHPYLLAMCAPMVAAWTVTAARAHPRRARFGVVAGTSALACAIAIYAAFGLLRSAAIGERPWGYGHASFNPAALLASSLGLAGRVLPPEAADATGYQYEGCAYLGIGLLVLVAAAFVVRRRGLALVLRRHAVLLSVVALLAIFALSNRIYVGRSLVASFDLPAALQGIVHQFRSTGRFVWPAVYLLLFFAVATVARAHRFGPWAVLAAATVQLVDVSPFYGRIRQLTDGPDPKLLDWAAWQPLIERHRSLVLQPTFDCAFFLRHVNAGSGAHMHELSLLGAAAGLETNSMYAARTRRACHEEVAERETIVADDGALYVFMWRVATGSALANLERQGARCFPFDDGYACSKRFGEEAPAALSTTGYVLGTPLSFGPEGAAHRHEGPGWSPQDEKGTALGHAYEGPRTTLHFVPESPAPAYELELGLDVQGEGEISAAVNGTGVGSVAIGTGDVHASLSIPGDVPAAERYLAVDLELDGDARVYARTVVLRSADDVNSPRLR